MTSTKLAKIQNTESKMADMFQSQSASLYQQLAFSVASRSLDVLNGQ